MHYRESPTLMKKYLVPSAERDNRALLDYRTYGFTEADLDRTFTIDLPHSGAILASKKQWKLRDLLESYEKAYCGKIGVEFMHLADRDANAWIRNKFESIQYDNVTEERKLKMFDRLNWAHSWGEFLSQKYNTAKRFGLEGCEAFVPGLKFAIDRSVELGGETFIIGMPHRGRLNVLANVVRKPMEQIMAEF
jgi:2-oxoglutarate dehydrogenase E1 component